jgi:hypothetical protein
MKTKPTTTKKNKPLPPPLLGRMPFENNDDPDPNEIGSHEVNSADLRETMKSVGRVRVGDKWVKAPSSQKLSQVTQKAGSLSKLPTQRPRKKGAL